jgi:hypothetical protein
MLDLLTRYRKCGCHIVPVNGKSELVKPIALAKSLHLPTFVIVDADTDAKPQHAPLHKKDNGSILKLMGYGGMSDWPNDDIWRDDVTMWKTNLTQVVSNEIGPSWKGYTDEAAKFYGQPGGLEKNPLAIARALEAAWENKHRSRSLERLANSVVSFAENAVGTR